MTKHTLSPRKLFVKKQYAPPPPKKKKKKTLPSNTFIFPYLPTSSAIGVEPSSCSNMLVFSKFLARVTSNSVTLEHSRILQEKRKEKQLCSGNKSIHWFFNKLFTQFTVTAICWSKCTTSNKHTNIHARIHTHTHTHTPPDTHAPHSK